MSDVQFDYLSHCLQMVDRVTEQHDEIVLAAEWFADSILKRRLVHLFAAGHSRIMVEEMWPRYGSFPGFNPIVELSLTFHNLVVGANGQRQAMFLETQSGLAERILRNYDLSSDDSGLVISSSGCNTVPIEVAQQLQAKDMKVVALVSREHSDQSSSNHPEGIKLGECADLVLDTGAPAGDAVVKVDGLDTPVSPASTVGGCMVVNCIKAEVASRLVSAGVTPKVLTAGCIVGGEKAKELFEAAYDEHGRRVAQLYANLGQDPPAR